MNDRIAPAKGAVPLNIKKISLYRGAVPFDMKSPIGSNLKNKSHPVGKKPINGGLKIRMGISPVYHTQ